MMSKLHLKNTALVQCYISVRETSVYHSLKSGCACEQLIDIIIKYSDIIVI